ncbi:uncharacterized protein LOC135167632 [Diachasmimorpha longicaudata]|uniref:uncharacterized protein LOC135167632 n=1 Tax=Diachasmimorpha longicaudata TaxID=58733 RepID=UPI0030B88A36
MNLLQLSEVTIPRWLGLLRGSVVEVHGFSDASQVAMAAVVYLKVPHQPGGGITLVCYTTKVARLKRLTVPRLEPTAALLLAKLIRYVQDQLNLRTAPTYLSTDSSVTLTWISSHSSRWKEFVRNRVGPIQGLTQPAHWRLVPGKENRADCASRDLSAQQLTAHNLWWTGLQKDLNVHLEEKPGLLYYGAAQELALWDLIGRFSSFNRLLRITAICRRFIAWLRRMRVLRVGGRLKFAQLDPESRNQAIIPNESQVAHLLIDQAHLWTLHSGIQLTLRQLRSSCRILGGRAPVRSFILKCVRCARQRGICAQQLIGQLPPARLAPARAFFDTGVDYAGPVALRSWKGRGYKSYKGWLAIFVCMTTSAVHLEVTAHSLFSDCGTTFIGADKELRTLFSAGSFQPRQLVQLLINDGPHRSLNPPGAPHFGGKWEAAIKSVKFHLTRTFGEDLLTFKQLTTLLAQVKAVLNSRPLEPLTDDFDDYSALTPGHFLIGQDSTTLPEPSLENLNRLQAISKGHHPTRHQRRLLGLARGREVPSIKVASRPNDRSTPWQRWAYASSHAPDRSGDVNAPHREARTLASANIGDLGPCQLSGSSSRRLFTWTSSTLMDLRPGLTGEVYCGDRGNRTGRDLRPPTSWMFPGLVSKSKIGSSDRYRLIKFLDSNS